MRTLLMAGLIALASLAFAQNDKGKPANDEQQKPQPQAAQDDAKVKERIRVDGAAGGTAPVPEEKRKAVGAGAGPHLHNTLPSPAKLPRDEPVEPPK
ncbi:MAG TPA: hypothetical protein VGJ74_08340 [Burkholderiales bacterium]|jgi:hypothetical protein